MSRKLILLVDDDRDTLEGYTLLFQALGHATAGATDGPTALAAVLHLRPDLMLLDLGLPRMSGLEVLRRIRAEDAGARIPVVILTGSALPNEVAEARRLGCEVVLTKPCEAVALCQAVEASLHATMPADTARDRTEAIRVRPGKPSRSAARGRTAEATADDPLARLVLWADFLARRSEDLRETSAGLMVAARANQAWSLRLRAVRSGTTRPAP